MQVTEKDDGNSAHPPCPHIPRLLWVYSCSKGERERKNSKSRARDQGRDLDWQPLSRAHLPGVLHTLTEREMGPGALHALTEREMGPTMLHSPPTLGRPSSEVK